MHYIKKTVVDVILFSLSFCLAFLIRFEISSFEELLRQVHFILPIIVGTRLVVFILWKIYNTDYGYFSTPDALSIFYAIFTSSGLIFGLSLFFQEKVTFSRSVFIVDGILLFVLNSGMRFLIRSYRQKSLFRRRRGKPLLIIGAGDAADSVLREIKIYNHYNFYAVGLTDDSPLKKNKIIQGVKVLGTSQKIPEIVRQHNVETLLIAIPSATRSEISTILNYCQDLEIQVLTMPFLQELNKEKPLMNQIKEVHPEEFLFRDKIELNSRNLLAEYDGKRVLVTGGGGSIGSELCRQLASLNLAQLIVFERSEFNLFQIDKELKHKFPDISLHPIIGDVSDYKFTLRQIEKFQPEIIFHAAAYKHVSLVELNPEISIKNNIIGTMNVVQAAVKTGVDKFVLISTDKAANPTSIMGATKRICEEYVRAIAKEKNNHFYGVRFGNVLGSSGSVLQIFSDQVAQGGPVTVSHRDAYRYFMTISEAVQLVLQTTVFDRGGEIFILDMGEPVRIFDLAKKVIFLSGFKPDQDINIVFTGLKNGEKLTEDLYELNEKLEPTPHKKIFRIGNSNHSMKLSELTQKIDELQTYAYSGNRTALLQMINNILPNFQHAEQDFAMHSTTKKPAEMVSP